MFRTRLGLVHAMYLAERWDEAHAVFRELVAEAPEDVMLQGYFGVLAARRGDREEALRIGSQLESITDPYEFGRDIYLQAPSQPNSVISTERSCYSARHTLAGGPLPSSYIAIWTSSLCVTTRRFSSSSSRRGKCGAARPCGQTPT